MLQVILSILFSDLCSFYSFMLLYPKFLCCLVCLFVFWFLSIFACVIFAGEAFLQMSWNLCDFRFLYIIHIDNRKCLLNAYLNDIFCQLLAPKAWSICVTCMEEFNLKGIFVSIVNTDNPHQYLHNTVNNNLGTFKVLMCFCSIAYCNTWYLTLYFNIFI